jgi:hypothetical protein
MQESTDEVPITLDNTQIVSAVHAIKLSKRVNETCSAWGLSNNEK